MLWLLLPLGIYWVLFDQFLVYAGYPWLLGGRMLVWIMLAAAVSGFAFPRAIPDLARALWDASMGLVRRWWWF